MRRVRQTRPRTLVRTVTAALALVLLAPLAGSTSATADEPAPQARKLASQRQVALATPGDFTGYGFDQCVAPEPVGDGRVVEEVAVHRGRHLHLRRLPRLPRPAQPDAPPGSPPRSPAAGGCCRSPSARRRRASRASRATRTTSRSPRTRHRRLRHGGRAGRGRGGQDRRRRSDVRHRRGQHDLVRPRGLRPAATPTAASPPWSSVRVGHSDQGARLHRRLLLQRQLGHQDARRRPPPAPRPFTLPDRIWVARWDGAPNTSTTYIPEDGWRPGGRMKQYLGGHNETWGGVTINIDSNYIDLGAGLPAASGGPLPRHPARLLEVPRALAVVREVHARQGAAVPARRAGHLLRSDQRLVRRPHHRRRPRLAVRPQVHAEQHLREAALDRAARRRCPYDGQARVGRRVGPPAPAGAQRGRRGALPGDRGVRRQDRGGRADLPVTPQDRRLRRRHAPDLEQAAAGSLTRVQVAARVLPWTLDARHGVRRADVRPLESRRGRGPAVAVAGRIEKRQAGGPTTSATPVRPATAMRPTSAPWAGRRTSQPASRSRRPCGSPRSAGARRRRAAPRARRTGRRAPLRTAGPTASEAQRQPAHATSAGRPRQEHGRQAVGDEHDAVDHAEDPDAELGGLGDVLEEHARQQQRPGDGLGAGDAAVETGRAHAKAFSTRRGEEAEPVGAGTGEVLDRVLGVRHQADDVAALVGDAGDVTQRAVGVVVEVARDDAALALEPVEGRLVGDEPALAVLEHDR